jgi:hypothetical protein
MRNRLVPRRAGSAVTLLRLSRGFLLLAALDTAVAALWVLLRPADLLAFLGAPPTHDALLLARALAALLLAGQAPCLVLAAARPDTAGGLALVPLAGRAQLAGVWLWLLGTDRVVLPARPLGVLLAHDGLGLAVLGLFLVARSAGRPERGGGG